MKSLDRTGAGLSADDLSRGCVYVLRPVSRVVLGLMLSLTGLLLGVVELFLMEDSDRLVVAIAAGPVSTLLMWLGLASGPLARLEVSRDGISVWNPLIRAHIAWCCLVDAGIGEFGLRLGDGVRSIPVFVAQVANRELARPEGERPITRLAERLLLARDQIVDPELVGACHDQCRIRRRLNPPAVIAVALLLYSVAVVGYVYGAR